MVWIKKWLTLPGVWANHHLPGTLYSAMFRQVSSGANWSRTVQCAVQRGTFLKTADSCEYQGLPACKRILHGSSRRLHSCGGV